MTDRSPEAMSIPTGQGRTVLLALAGLALIAGAASAFAAGTSTGHATRFAFAYLTAYSFVASLAVGALFWIMIHHLTDAGWSVVVRRPLENMARTLPWMIVLFLPLAWATPRLYAWADAAGHSSDPLWVAKRGWLNEPFFWGRAAFYLVAWSVLAEVLARRSARQDAGRDPAISAGLRAFSAPGMIVLALTTTFAAFDWLMTLDYKWYSTIYGVYFWAGSIVGSLSTLILAVLYLRRRGGPLAGAVTVEHLHDLGKLLLGFVVFWAYIAFSQYFLIWYANLPEETGYFIVRKTGTWGWASLALAVGHFAIPFLLLLPRNAKRNPARLGFAAAWVLGFHYLDLYWQVMPTLTPRGVSLHWLDLAVPVALVAAFAALAWRAGLGRPMVPIGDPRLEESLAFRNV